MSTALTVLSGGDIAGWPTLRTRRQHNPNAWPLTRLLSRSVERGWVDAAIDVDSQLLLDIELFSHRGTNPVAASLHRLTEKHDLSHAEFLVDGDG